MTFELIPAIDLMGGSVVRLVQGDAERKTRYAVDAAETAQSFFEAGARRLHVVDLDGAFTGEPANLEAIRRIRQSVPGMKVEVGGGLRTEESVARLFDAGVDCAVVGTKALEEPAFVATLVKKYGADRIIVGADARNGFLATRGWTSDAEVPVGPFLSKLHADTGFNTVIFTDIARDGMLTGPNVEALQQVLAVDGLKVIASGGVGEAAHISQLRDLRAPNLLGVIVGKALYDGRLTPAEGVAAAS